MMEQGQADLYNACEWGNYSRVETTKVGSRQVGRRSIVTFAALVVRGRLHRCRRRSNSPTCRSASRCISGTHYLCLQMLEGFVPRDLIKIGRVPNGSNYRFKMLMDETIEATTLTEPYISLAEKMGCRVVISAFHHGTEVASDRVDAETYAAFNRAVREAVRRINANKPPICTTSSTTIGSSIRRSISSPSTICAPSRLYLVDPAPIPADELQRTYDWMKSWDFLETGVCPNDLVNMNVQIQGNEKQANEPAAAH